MTVSWPKAYNDRAPSEYADWPSEKRWALKTLDAARSQLMDIQVATAADRTYADRALNLGRAKTLQRILFPATAK